MTTVELNALSSGELVRRLFHARFAGRVSRKDDPLRLRFAARNEAIRIKKILVQRGALPCPRCGGMGTQERLVTRCGFCDGKGVFDSDEPNPTLPNRVDWGEGFGGTLWDYVRCYACKGKGGEVVDDPCTRCGGTGKVADSHP